MEVSPIERGFSLGGAWADCSLFHRVSFARGESSLHRSRCSPSSSSRRWDYSRKSTRNLPWRRPSCLSYHSFQCGTGNEHPLAAVRVNGRTRPQLPAGICRSQMRTLGVVFRPSLRPRWGRYLKPSSVPSRPRSDLSTSKAFRWERKSRVPEAHVPEAQCKQRVGSLTGPFLRAVARAAALVMVQQERRSRRGSSASTLLW